MAKMKWDFPELRTGNEQGYSDAGIELFKGTELIDNLAREICQNSLDAHDKSNNPVIVTFDLNEFEIDNYSALRELKSWASGCKKYWSGRKKKIKENEFISTIEKVFAEKHIKTLVIRDFNTKGLTGINASHDDDSAWRSLTNSDGSSDKENNTSGGNFGIGKNAPFACSAIKTVFYNTRAIDDNICAFQGTAKWVSMYDDNDIATVGVGHYLKFNDEHHWGPVLQEDNDSFAKEFYRKENEFGTDVIVLGFEEKNWKDAIAVAVLKNFFVAIVENKLVVKVGEDLEISYKTIENIIEKYSDNHEFQRSKTKELYYAYVNPTETFSFDIIEENDVTFKIKIDESYSKVYANFRNNGMLIDKYSKRSIPVFAAVLVVNDGKLSELLRDTEPPRHNLWDYKRIPKDTEINKNKRKLAKEKLSEIQKNIIEVLDKYSGVEIKGSLDGGIGEYLGYDNNKQSAQEGQDKLRVVQKITSIKSKKGRKSYEKGLGGDAIGKPKKKTKPHDNIPKPPGPEPRPKPKPPVKIVDISDIDNTKGVATGKGKLYINATDIIAERTYPIGVGSSNGIYRTIILTNKDQENIYLKISAARDDNKEEILKPVSFTIDKVKKRTNESGLIGPVSLKSGQKNSLVMEFTENERMVLSVTILEEIDNEKK